jgi:hypothetical protein
MLSANEMPLLEFPMLLMPLMSIRSVRFSVLDADMGLMGDMSISVAVPGRICDLLAAINVALSILFSRVGEKIIAELPGRFLSMRTILAAIVLWARAFSFPFMVGILQSIF